VQAASAACAGITVLNGQAAGVNWTAAIRQPAHFSPSYTSF
jgi:hypothetical protein